MEFIRTIALLSFIISLTSCSDSDNSDPEPMLGPETSITIISSAQKTVDHNREYRYQIGTSLTEGDTVIYNVTHPAWLNFDYVNGLLSGVAGWGNENKSFNISVQASNQIDEVRQIFSIAVTLGEIICNSSFGDPMESGYILPFEVGKSFNVNQSYCPSNPAWGHNNWFAYDFEMPIGTKILAMKGGEVIGFVESNNDGTRVCGEENLILILQDDGAVASYYHLTKNGVLVNLGQEVNRGDVIGLSGDSGCSIGPHLHIAVFRERGKHFRQYTMPINFRNAKGSLDENNGLVYNQMYESLPY